MRYSLNLLKKYIGVQDTAENISHHLTLKTCEIEEIIERKLPAEVVIGKVTETKKHPTADKLTICQLDCGSKGTYQICTGGENVTANTYVPVAIPGCYLPAIDLKIEPRKLRGEDSNGMICSKGELGIIEDEDKHWIWTMNEDLSDITDADLGTSLGDKYPWMNNSILDVDNKTVTHRPDLTGHFGIAWELQAIYSMRDEKISFNKLPERKHTFDTTNILDTLSNANKASRSVNVETADCQSYIALEYNNISVQRSSIYTRLMMQDIGQQSRTNRVDFSNLFMMTTGQPVHFFDADTLKGNITVRNAKEGETFTDLFDKTHSLDPQDIVICDDEKILALGGVVGGKTSGVTESTKNIIVEIAHFDPVAVRKTGTRLGLRTDAELRFEKHINPQFSAYALLLFLNEIQFFAKDLGEHTFNGLSYHIGEKLHAALGAKKKISIDPKKGTILIFGEENKEFETIAEKVLMNLGFIYENNVVTVPLWRSPDDMNIPEDIYEEIVRIYGYDHIAPRGLSGNTQYVPYSPEVALQRMVEDYLIHEAHMDQCETYPWADEKSYNNFWRQEGEKYTLLNPSAPELRYLRPEIIYSMMEIVEKNHRTFDEIKCFDTGKIWPVIAGKPTEMKALGMIHYKKNIGNREEDTIFDMKGHLYALLKHIGVKEIELMPTAHTRFHPKKQAEIKADGKIIGYIATIHPLIAQRYKISDGAQTTFVSLGMDTLNEYMHKPKDTSISYQTLQDQIVTRDVCFILDKDKEWNTIIEPIKNMKNIGDITLFDLYAGNKIPEGKKSIAFSFSIKGDGNITSEQINAITQDVIKTAETHGATLRN